MYHHGNLDELCRKRCNGCDRHIKDLKDWFLRNWLIQVVLPLPEGPEMAMRWDMGKEFTVCGSGRVP
jgi:hypothetical protein